MSNTRNTVTAKKQSICGVQMATLILAQNQLIKESETELEKAHTFEMVDAVSIKLNKVISELLALKTRIGDEINLSESQKKNLTARVDELIGCANEMLG